MWSHNSSYIQRAPSHRHTSQAWQEMNRQKLSPPANGDCGEAELPQFLAMLKYIMLYLSAVGIHVPHVCSKCLLTPENKTSDQSHSPKYQTHTSGDQTHTSGDQTHTSGDQTHRVRKLTHKTKDQTQMSKDETSAIVEARPLYLDVIYGNETIPVQKCSHALGTQTIPGGRRQKATENGKPTHWIRQTKLGKVIPLDKVSLNRTIFREQTREVYLPSCYQKSCVGYLKIFFSILYSVIQVLDVARLLYILPRTVKDDSLLVYCVSNISYHLFVLFLTFSSNFANYHHFRPLCQAWLEYERKYGLATDPNKHWRGLRLFLVVGTLLKATVFLVILVGILTSFNGLYFFIWPFDVSQIFSKVTAAIFFATLSLFASCSTFSLHIFRSTLVCLLTNEFHHLHDRMKETLFGYACASQVEDEFDQLTDQLQRLLAITDRSFHVVKHTIASAYIFTPVLLCLILYDLAGGHMAWNQNLLTLYTIVIVILMTATATRVCALLRSSARSVWSVVYRAPWYHHTPAMLHKLSIFMQHLSIDEVGFSFYGMFIVDYSTLLMVGGTVLTYGIIVLQIKFDRK